MDKLTNRHVFKKNMIVLSLSLALTACDLTDSDDDKEPEQSAPVENTTPAISSSAANTVEAGSAYSYTLVSSDADGDALTLSASSIPAWLSFDAATGILSGTPAESDEGDHDIVLTVSDGEDEVSQSFTITVTLAAPENTAPVITSTSIDTATAGSAYSYTLIATDADDDSLTMSATTKPAWLSFDAATGILSGTPAESDEGDSAVVLSVTDGTDEVTQSFDITVTVPVPENNAPVITSTGITDATVGEAYSYTLTATDADSDTLTLSADIPAALSWLTFDAATGILSGTPASGDIAATELTLTVNDGTVDTEQTFTITVAEAEEEKTPVLVVFEEDANPLWPAWDCCGSSTPAIITDADAGYGQVTQFTINGDTVVGFNARDAEDGVAFDTPAGTTLEFDLKVTTMPTNVDAVWKLKVEDSGDGAKEVDLTTSVEGQAPVLDTWLHYTFNTADLGLSNIDLIMMFPAWGTGDGAEFSVDNVKFYFDEQVGERTPGLSGNGATTTTAIGVDFEGSQLTWESFDTAKVQFVANPKTNGINTSSTVALFDILQGDGEWIGARTEGIDNFALDASNCVVKLDVYKDTISNVSVKFEKQHSDGWGSSGHISAANTVTNQWETLSFDFCSVIGHAENDDIGGFAIFPDNTGSRSQNTMNYIDNLMFTAQGDVEEPVGGELVLNGGFDNGSDNWVMGGAVITEGDNSVFQATVDAPGDVWSVNLSQVMTLVAGQSYTLTFKAKAEVARTIVVGLGFNHDPWTASTENVTLTTEWATYTYTITPEAGDDNSRVLFDMGGEAGDVYLDDISVVAVD